MARNPTLSIIISDEDKERLKRVSLAKKRTMSQLASIIIQEYLDLYDAELNAAVKQD